MIEKIKYLPWDSENFGFKVGKFKINDLKCFSWNSFYKEVQANSYKLVYLISPIKLDIDAFYDCKLTYHKIKGSTSLEKNSHIFSYKGKTLSNQLFNLAFESGKYSRYYLDDQFPNDKFKLLYGKWLDNSLRTDYASDVLVYMIKDKAVGLLTYKISDKQSSIGIIATESDCQGHGIGASLMKHYEAILPKSIETLNVVTQGVNHVARNFYEKFGYTIAESCYVYHIWFK